MKNQNLPLKRFGVMFVITALGLTGCSESFDTSYFDKEIESAEIPIAIPIGYTTYTAKELFEEINDELEVGTTDDNGKSVVSFTYNETLDESENSDFVSIDNQEFEGTFTLFEPGDIPSATGTYTYGTNPAADATIGTQQNKMFDEIEVLTNSDNSSLDYNLESVEFSSGSLMIELETTAQAKTEITFKIPSLIHKTTSLAYNETFILNNNSGSDTSEISVNLNDYEFDLTIDGLNPTTKNGFNSIGVEVDATVTFANNNVLSTTDQLSYTVNLLQPVVEKTSGDFKQQSFQVDNSTFDIDFFEEIGDGSILFENPILKISANNEYGFPVGLVLDNISTNATNNNTLAIIDNGSTTDNIVPNTDDGSGNYAVIKAGVNNTATTTPIQIDGNNSNLADLLNEKPSQFNLSVTAVANPNSPTGNSNTFDINNKMSVSVDIELPLYVTFKNLEFDPEPFEFEAEDIDDIATNLKLRLATKNSIPLNGSIELEFVKNIGTEQNPNYQAITYTTNNVVKTLTKTVTLIDAAPVDSNGFSQYSIDGDGNLKQGTSIVEPTVSEISFNEDEITALENVTHVQAIIKFDTTDSTGDGNANAVKIQSTDEVRLELAAEGNIKLSSDDENN